MTDPLADLLTRVRNGLAVRARSVKVPHSKLKKAIVQVLKENGFIDDWTSELIDGKAFIRVHLRYGPDGEEVIRHIRRVSKPGLRVYRQAGEMPEPLNGLGIAVVSTSRGVMTQVEAKKQNVGGEVLCEVW
jgi:small subunit ribosomal protein S8